MRLALLTLIGFTFISCQNHALKLRMELDSLKKLVVHETIFVIDELKLGEEIEDDNSFSYILLRTSKGLFALNKNHFSKFSDQELKKLIKEESIPLTSEGEGRYQDQSENIYTSLSALVSPKEMKRDKSFSTIFSRTNKLNFEALSKKLASRYGIPQYLAEHLISQYRVHKSKICFPENFDKFLKVALGVSHRDLHELLMAEDREHDRVFAEKVLNKIHLINPQKKSAGIDLNKLEEMVLMLRTR